jgi:hypothetical protein
MWLVFSLLQLSEFFLSSVCWVLIMMCLGVFLFFCLDSLVFCKLPVPGWLSFLRLRKISAIILLNKLSMHLVCISSLSTPMIHRFGLFMVPQIFCMFHLYFLSILSWSFTVWSNSSILSSVPYTLFSACSIPFTKLLIQIFIWDIELIISDYFSGFPYLYWFPLSYLR